MLAFLQKIEVAPAEGTTVRSSTAKKQRQPLTADLRVWANGAVYPSNALITEFNLEYAKKGADEPGYGFDIVQVSMMSRQLQIPEDTKGIIIGAVNRSHAKLDLFSSCVWNKDTQEPVASVAEQGSYTYGASTLLPLLKSEYGVEPNEEGYIDLVLVREKPLVSPNNVYNVPKAVTKGENAGKTTNVRREYVTFYGLAPASMMQSAGTQLEIEFPEASAVNVEGTMVQGEVTLESSERAEPIDYFAPEYDEQTAQ